MRRQIDTVFPRKSKSYFRIGGSISDIIIDGDDIFPSDSRYIAARLETLCEPGQAYAFSRAANDQIRDKLSMAFADLGEQAMKNISHAVGVFGLHFGKGY